MKNTPSCGCFDHRLPESVVVFGCNAARDKFVPICLFQSGEESPRNTIDASPSDAVWYSLNQRMPKASHTEINHPMLAALSNTLPHRVLITLAESKERAGVLFHDARHMLNLVIKADFCRHSEHRQNGAILGSGLPDFFRSI